MNILWRNPITLLALFTLILIGALPQPTQSFQTDPSNPPDEIVKLIFIHHSTGENWLADGYGDLGRTLGENNYFVSDTNYGWGPDTIGDRTDIPNWPEWFSSNNTPAIMNALLNESGQHASYTRTLPDPGGTNQIIMFKSCFPNSALKGSPNDPAGTYEELSVGSAKYVYNTILGYFATRPDKLFVVVTAPPLSDGTYAKNARAFNQWLLKDWLRENNYTLNNVAVFDFYNILTDPNAHHRFYNGQIEYIPGAINTLIYPSGDDHPSEEGSRKATEEFLPMLNVFYHRWKETTPVQGSPELNTVTQTGVQPEAPAIPSIGPGMIENFDHGIIPGTNGWEAFRDEGTATMMKCGAAPGTNGNSLKLEYNIAPNSWGTCALMYETPQDWSTANGLMFSFHSEQAEILFDVNLYAGTPDNRETYLYTAKAPANIENGWEPMEIRWIDFHRASWEENAGMSFSKADQITGIAFGLGTTADAPNEGTFRVDNITLTEIPALAPPFETQQPVPLMQTAPTKQSPQAANPLFPCAGAMSLPFAAIARLGVRRKIRF